MREKKNNNNAILFQTLKTNNFADDSITSEDAQNKWVQEANSFRFLFKRPARVNVCTSRELIDLSFFLYFLLFVRNIVWQILFTLVSSFDVTNFLSSRGPPQGLCVAVSLANGFQTIPSNRQAIVTILNVQQ